MSSRRIILNTSATYLRSVVAAGFGLFSSRWVLGALGPSDFGLFSVVGAIIVFITFFNGVMAGSASRHFAFAVGRGDAVEVNKWFNTSLNIHLILPVVLILIGWPIGEYCIRHVFTIPVERIPACLWVFRLSLITAFVGMVSIPFSAMFAAKQHLAELAAWGTLESVLSFVFAYLLTQVSGDRLLFCASYGMAINVSIQGIQVIRARHLFPECRCNFDHWFDRQRFREVLSFAGWSLVGWFSGMVRLQGPAILLNLSFGPKVNAAYGIASNVARQTVTLSTAMISALAPEITAREGRGDRDRMTRLAFDACKFSTLLVMLFAIPLVVEMDYVLKLWLRTPPEHTTFFCQLMLASLLVDQMTVGHMMAINASGRIAAYQVTVGGFNLLTIPVAWLALKLGAAPTSVGVVLLGSFAICSLWRVLWARRLVQMPAWKWVTDVLFACGCTAIGATLAALLPSWFLPPTFVRLLLSAGASILVIGCLGWWVVLNGAERVYLLQRVRLAMGRVPACV